MGVLRDHYYWAGVFNAIIANEASESIFAEEHHRKTACAALKRLLDDADLDQDIAYLAEVSDTPAWLDGRPFISDLEFSRSFIAVERMVLREAGLSEAAVADLSEQMLPLLFDSEIGEGSLSNFRDHVQERIEIFCSEKAFRKAKKEMHSPRRGMWDVTKRTIGGISIMTANAGVAMASTIYLGPLGVPPSLLAGLSVEKGARMWKQAWDGRW